MLLSPLSYQHLCRRHIFRMATAHKASSTWETRLELITAISTLAICKLHLLQCLEAFFGQLRTKEMPSSVLKENKLLASVASPAVAS